MFSSEIVSEILSLGKSEKTNPPPPAPHTFTASQPNLSWIAIIESMLEFDTMPEVFFFSSHPLFNRCIDYKPFLKILNKKKYKGWLVVEAEQDPVKANPFEYAKIGYNYLSKTAKECGFEIIS